MFEREQEIANQAIDVFISKLNEDAIIPDDVYDELCKYQVVVGHKKNFCSKIRDFFLGKKKQDDEEFGCFIVVKMVGYENKPDSDDSDNEDSNDFLKRIGVL